MSHLADESKKKISKLLTALLAVSQTALLQPFTCTYEVFSAVMSALKRKNGPEAVKATKGNPAKRTKTDTPEKKTKAAKTDKSPKLDKTKDTEASNLQPAKSSVLALLKDEEPMFPRGGGNILTPLEQKQIQMRAKADAQDEDELDVASKSKAKKKRKDKTSKKSDKQASHPVHGEDSVRVESLNFKVGGSAQYVRTSLTCYYHRDW